MVDPIQWLGHKSVGLNRVNQKKLQCNTYINQILILNQQHKFNSISKIQTKYKLWNI